MTPSVTPSALLMTWDEARHLTSISYPDGRVITNEYNQAGFLVGVQWPENKVTNAYDCACGRLGGIYATNGASLIFGYDGGLLTNLTQSGVITGRMSYSYNNDFRVAGIGFGGNVAAYNYDVDGLLTNAGGMRLYRDAASGWLTNAVVGDISDRRQYNGFGEMGSYKALFDNDYVYYGVDYSYDKLGRITNRLERIEGATNNYAYVYDSVGRLHEVYTNGSLRARYWYDANGNRTNSWIAGSSRTYQYDAQDRLTGSFWGLIQYQYNANGQMTNMYGAVPTRATRYDTRGSLMEVRVGTNTYEYLLDPLGRRVGKKVNGVLNKGWVYQGFLTPAAEVNSSNQLVARFVYATRVNVPDYMQTTGNVYRIITDHLGSVRLVIEVDSGAVVQRLDYDEWGNVLQDTNPGFQPFGFAGGLYDPDTGLTRFGYRDYDPATGRWLAKDPILFAGGQANLYRYCFNNPIMLIDPFGLGTECASSGDNGHHYTEEETQEIIDNLTSSYSCGIDPGTDIGNLWEAYQNHKGFGDFDYKAVEGDSTFQLPGEGTLLADEFGNYLAGYTGGLIDAYPLVRLGGMLYAIPDPSETWRDEGSLPCLEQGRDDATKAKSCGGDK